MIYCFWLILTVGAFWIVRMDEIHELLDGIYQSGRWPVTIYPGWLRISLTYLVPIAFAVTVPAEALTSRLTVETLVIAAVFALGLFLFSRWWWRFLSATRAPRPDHLYATLRHDVAAELFLAGWRAIDKPMDDGPATPDYEDTHSSDAEPSGQPGDSRPRQVIRQSCLTATSSAKTTSARDASAA